MKLLIRTCNPNKDNIQELADLFVMMVGEGTQKDWVDDVDRTRVLEYLYPYLQGTRQNSIMLVAYEDTELVGVLAAFHMQVIFSVDKRSCHELPWYVKPCKNRTAAWFGLLKAYEAWAIKEEVDLLTIGTYNERLLPIYENRGYNLYATTLRKRMK